MSALSVPLKRSRTASHPLRVFSFFAAGIILPSCFLSYLGFRSLQVENILQHKQTEERYSAVADVLQRKAADTLAELVQGFRHELGIRDLHRRGAASQASSLLSLNTVSGTSVKIVMLIEGSGRLLFPAGASDAHAPPSESRLDWGIYSRDISRLERMEFVDKNLSGVVSGYEALLPRVAEPSLHIALLKAIAAADLKLQRYQAAESRYLELVNRYDQTPDAVGYPVGVLGRQLLATVYDDSDQPERALNIRLELAQQLLLGHWAMDIADRNGLVNSLKPAIERGLGTAAARITEARAQWLRLQALQARIDQARSTAEAFARTDWSALQQRLDARAWTDQGGVLRLGDTNDLVIVEPIDENTHHANSVYAVAVVEGGPFIATLEKAAAELAQTSGLQIEWSDLPPSPAQGLAKLTTMLRPYLERSVDTIDPPLTFRLLENTTLPQDLLRRRREWIFFGMIGLSLLVIVVGLLVMAQAIRREIEVANLKADFVANVSHELRTPLSSISYIGERLSLGRYRSPEEAKEFYDMLGQETGRLKELIEDVLDFSKMLDGRKAYQREPQDLVALAHEALERFRGKAASHQVDVLASYPDQPLIVWLDRKAVLQAILNLLDNALKYSPGAPQVKLSVYVEKEMACLSVQDFGVGISEAEQSKIFEKFYRVESSMARSSEGGVGLGLAMVKHIADGHDGALMSSAGWVMGARLF